MDMWVFKADFGKTRWLGVKDLVVFVEETMCLVYVPSGGHGHWGSRSPKKYIPSYFLYDIMSSETSLFSLKGSPYMEQYRQDGSSPKKVSN
jgi:hypothetical protein